MSNNGRPAYQWQGDVLVDPAGGHLGRVEQIHPRLWGAFIPGRAGWCELFRPSELDARQTVETAVAGRPWSPG